MLRRFQDAGVTDHVGIGVVADDRIVLAFLDSRDQFVGHQRRVHFRLQVVGGHHGRLDQDTILVLERRFLATVEEEGDMGILLGFSTVELFITRHTDYLTQGRLGTLRREANRRKEFWIVFGQAGDRDW